MLARVAQNWSQTLSIIGAEIRTAYAGPEAVRYTRESLLRGEFIYGRGFQSPGGADGLNKTLSAQMGLKKGMRVVDLGCGTGGTSFHLAKTYGCSVVGLDLFAACLEVCNERNIDTASLVSFKQGSMTDSGVFPAGSFDAAWTRDAGMYLDEEQKVSAFSNIYSWLKPGSLFLVTDYARGPGAGFKADAYEKLAQINLHSLEVYQSTLERSGFVVEKAQYLPEFDEQYHKDLERFIGNKNEFIARFGEEQYESYRSRWVLKCEAIKEGSFVGLSFYARKPPAA